MSSWSVFQLITRECICYFSVIWSFASHYSSFRGKASSNSLGSTLCPEEVPLYFLPIRLLTFDRLSTFHARLSSKFLVAIRWMLWHFHDLAVTFRCLWLIARSNLVNITWLLVDQSTMQLGSWSYDDIYYESRVRC